MGASISGEIQEKRETLYENKTSEAISTTDLYNKIKDKKGCHRLLLLCLNGPTSSGSDPWGVMSVPQKGHTILDADEFISFYENHGNNTGMSVMASMSSLFKITFDVRSNHSVIYWDSYFSSLTICLI